MKVALAIYSVSLLLIARPAYAADVPPAGHALVNNWDSAAAARYLDERQTWWMRWPSAQRDHHTACVSCHTAVPYAMARPVLRIPLGEHAISAPEQIMLTYIRKRVNLGKQIKPFYNDEDTGPNKTAESLGTEAVMNALILARYDNQKRVMSEVTRKAFSQMWSAQLTTGGEQGSWNWLNFQNAPWESDESHYYGATLAAIAVGLTPVEYRKSREVQLGLSRLELYLDDNYDKQPLVNRLVILWASSMLPELLTTHQRDTLLTDIRARQQADGGWSLTNLGKWKRNDGTALDIRSDGYATGLTIYALKQAGIPVDSAEMQKGVQWLRTHQDAAQGLWPAYSLNKQRDPASDVGRFMSDAATSYAVMALAAVQH